MADSLNARSYALRYTDVDSSLSLAHQALRLSTGYDDGKAEAWNNIAYVAYQQMRYDEALHILGHVYGKSRNQIELLCADAMSMKVAQRIGDGRLFFDRRLQALRRIKRIRDAKEELNEHQLHRFYYACTETHIVSSTYYYYLGLDSSAVAEIRYAAKDISPERDTLQWLYYNYMIGSGGLSEGDPHSVRLMEFDHLVRTFTQARARRVIYFEANALQSLASCLNDSVTLGLVTAQRRDAYEYIVRQSLGVETDARLSAPHDIPYALATKAERMFRSYKDLYQTACAVRTLGEILFSAGEYELALKHFREALALVDTQRDRGTHDVVSWMASIHERLSVTYAALDMKGESDRHRNIYLDLLDESRQNREMDSRKEELSAELRAVNVKLLTLVALILLVFALAIAYSLHIRNHTRLYHKDILNVRTSPLFTRTMDRMKSLRHTLRDETEMLQDECGMLDMNIDDYRRGNMERRAKVALTYAIVPYLDRILAEARKMNGSGGVEKERVRYVAELTDEIMRVNDALTDWIQMRQGQLKLHITTFPLQDVMDIIRLGAHAFRQKGVELEVGKTDCMVKADKALTMFMANTLADNARKFTDAGGKVSVTATAAEAYVEVSVSDTGVGLSPEDVETLNNSKVYDSSHLGRSTDGKGFGFGIMNCKGIINKYRKQSSLFGVCDFGVESRPDEGSRFWFRLPRVLCIMAVFFLSALSAVDARSVSELYDSVYTANVEGRYAEAYAYGREALDNTDTPVDTALLVVLHNEMAISALAMHRWDDYSRHNMECVRLHRLYSQDATLASYCSSMEKAKSDGAIFLVLLVLLSLTAIVLFYLTFLRDRLRGKARVMDLRGRLDEALQSMDGHVGRMEELLEKGSGDLQSVNKEYSACLESMREAAMRPAGDDEGFRESVRGLFDVLSAFLHEVNGMLDECGQLSGRRDKARFEADRLYVKNQILDNALSTIKHETMYYPARMRQIVEAMEADGGAEGMAGELLDLVSYYRYVYMLLYEQAERQLERDSLRMGRVAVADLFAMAERKVSLYAARNGGRPSVSITDSSDAVLGDAMMLEDVILRILAANMPSSSAIVLDSDTSEGIVTVMCTFLGAEKGAEELHNLFSSMTADTTYLVVRQVMREHDALSGFPGLRLRAEAVDGGFRIILTLKEYRTRTTNN